jgi:hypothetical protein
MTSLLFSFLKAHIWWGSLKGYAAVRHFDSSLQCSHNAINTTITYNVTLKNLGFLTQFYI